MLKYTFILPVFIIALVFTRANVFAQNSKGTTDSSLRKLDVYEVLLNEGLDSVLTAMNLTRDDLRIVMDTELVKSKFSAHSSHGRDLKLQINKFSTDHTIQTNSNNEEKGIYFVSVSGKFCCLPDSLAERTFSFNRSRKYTTVFENEISTEPPSFWDSTAKPILVTLGAVAVIALFFLIRG